MHAVRLSRLKEPLCRHFEFTAKRKCSCRFVGCGVLDTSGFCFDTWYRDLAVCNGNARTRANDADPRLDGIAVFLRNGWLHSDLRTNSSI